MLTHSQTKMMDTVNAKSRPISFYTGDYVYLQSTPVGTGQKLQKLLKWPYVVKETVSTHLVKLFDPSSQKTLDKPVHVNRLKHAYVRAPTPENYFQITSSVYRDQAVQTSDLNQESVQIHSPCPVLVCLLVHAALYGNPSVTRTSVLIRWYFFIRSLFAYNSL